MNNLTERVKSLPAEKLDLLLRRLKPENRSQQPVRPADAARRLFVEARDHNFQLTIEHPGALDSLRFVAERRAALKRDDVEVEIEAACLNFRDVAVALGLYPMPANKVMPRFGCDGAGRVVAVGDAVTQFKVGDEVFFLSGDSTFARYARVPEMAVFRKPAHWTFEEAAGLPLNLITVFYSIRLPGRLTQGERILIHCAAGGIGLAAIQLARNTGAEIFATCGTEEKRHYLRSLGIEHVMDSRSLEFADQILAATDGEGVDVVLNSIAGEAIEAGLRVLRTDGRFLEIGKRDLMPGRVLDLAHFSRSITFAAVDIFALPFDLLHPIVREIRQAVADGSIQPLPTKTYKASEVIDAFRYMTARKHIGRIAVRMKGEPIYLSMT